MLPNPQINTDFTNVIDEPEARSMTLSRLKLPSWQEAGTRESTRRKTSKDESAFKVFHKRLCQLGPPTDAGLMLQWPLEVPQPSQLGYFDVGGLRQPELEIATILDLYWLPCALFEFIDVNQTGEWLLSTQLVDKDWWAGPATKLFV